MRVLLIYPQDPLLKERQSWGPYNLACLAAYLEDISDVAILDAGGYTVEETIERVDAYNPDIVGVTVPYTFFIPNALALCCGIKARQLERLIVTGGHGVTFIPEKMLESGLVDVVVRGEGELTLRELVQRGGDPAGVEGLSYLQDDTVVHTARRALMDLETSRLPAIHLMDLSGVSVYQMETSRGCPFECTFCDTSSFYGHRWRGKSPERVLKEIKLLVERYGAQTLLPADDNITTNMDRVYQIFKLLLENDLKVSMMLQMRADDIVRHPDAIEMMSRVGLDVILIGMESGNPDTLEQLKKRSGVDKTQQAAEILRSHGIHVCGFFILGFPHETAAAMEKTVDFAIETVDTMGANIFIPYPGTELHAHSEKEGLILTEDPLKYDQHHQVAKTVEWPDLDVELFYGQMLKKYYHRADWIREHFRVQPGHETQAVFSKGLWLKYVDFFDLDSVEDWQILLSAYADLSRDELGQRLAEYTAHVCLQTDLRVIDMPIVGGVLQAARAGQGQVDLILHVDNDTLSDLLRKMNLDALSAMVLGRVRVEGDLDDALAWAHWLNALQDIVDVQIINRAYDQPQCLDNLNAWLADDSAAAAEFARGIHTFVLGRNGTKLLVRLRAGAISDFKLLLEDLPPRRRFKELPGDQTALDQLVRGDGRALISFLGANR